jgi:alpha-L-rhamnosidase
MTSHLSVERRVDPLGIDVARPRFAWRPDADQAAYQLQVVDTDEPGASWSAPTWDSGRRAASDSTYVPYQGPALRSGHRYAWRVRVWTTDGGEGAWSEPAGFEVGLLEPTDWSARWIAHVVPDLVSEPEERRAGRPAPILRRRFALADAPRRARLYATALGVYEAYLNGARVGDQWLAPGWTDYDRRIQYQVFDVTDLLLRGDNVLAVRLGDGWYAGSVGAWGRHRYGDVPALLCQLDVRLPSGESLRVGSDAAWRGADSGTWLHDLQLGERTDLRKEPSGWGRPDFDDAAWRPVALRADPGARLVASRDDGVRVVDRLPARSVRAAEAGAPTGRHIVDLGANAAGVLRLALPAGGRPGRRIVVRHAEALDAQGELYTDNLRGAEQRDELVLADGGPAALEPRFTCHGFRYAEVAGLDRLEPGDVETRVLSSATRLVGSFECSEPLVNALQSNIVTSLRANFISVPTDCPQRNERLGWTADLQIFAPTALFNADVTNMLDKWLDDLADAQLPSGAYADVAPRPAGFVGWGDAAWSDAGVIVPWVLYERSGDADVLVRRYDSMRRYLRYLEADHTDGVRFAGRYGDWVSLGARTDKVFIGTAYLAHVAELGARIAAVVGRPEDEQRSGELAAHARRAFERLFLDQGGRLTVDTQTAYALALGFDLLPAELRPGAGARLARLVEEAGTHLATGFLGTPLVMPALSDHGQHELACRLLRQDTYPSWLFEVRQGATSIWERWNGWTPEHGFYSPLMNSLNHYAFGAVGDWMYRYLAGLDPVEPGYRRTALRPRPGAGFTAARATHESLYGVHACAWRLDGGSLHVDVQVPANTTATLELPPGAALRPTGDVRVEVPPGRHTFVADLRR